MAVEQLIDKGDKFVADKDFLSAISAYTSALKENPEAFQAYLKRSAAYVKFNNNDAAKRDISEAFTIAEKRGKRNDKASCYFKLGLINYKEKSFKEAYNNFKKAKEFGCTESTLDIWQNKIDYEIKKNPKILEEDSEDDEIDKALAGSALESVKKETPIASTNIDVINKQAPLNVKIRDDWYQSSDSVIITIYAKNVKEETLNIDFDKRSVSVLFPSATGSEYNYNMDPLFDEIDVENSKYKIYGTKLEVTLAKSKKIKWSSLEASEVDQSFVPTSSTSNEPNAALTYPSSSKKAINWDKFNLKDDDSKDDEEGDFFAKLYKDVDEDTRRAMMKSYVESNGTVLTTNWSEAKDKKFETTPPEGMQANSWNSKPSNK
ncbi:CS-domain-containing protein [Hyphopichia burtonii NRRL Y-1933]|uniref:CS-domain-containing protein n=1 Tax=Hyphopichia burtonii NRRL Y-1933 TaxID=984485 RepID=A0A1E4RLI9_9ASCO|nr:CS-domain-containing protein [Hyphopichia burtonii NRRL Y-1933]ODV68127.1 CS-domain-containing protein [Hyphopichia burtonii NRRL Y-1933]